MGFDWQELFHLAVRWTHVVAGLYWLGTTAYFGWLDRTIAREGKVWMIHSGGFYAVEKHGAEVPPGTLHWFKWEALVTGLSGLTLLFLVYHWGGLLVFPDGPVGRGAAHAIGMAVLVVGWLVYDLLWRSPIGRDARVGAAVSFALLVGTAYGLGRVLSGRAAYMHVGATLGTIMVLNVWMRILPAQKKLVLAAKEGRTPDESLARQSKARSKHNTFLALPVIFLMVSNHFPTVSYGHEWGWALLGGFVLAGWLARALLNRA
jgi:uncharacterized membrane protein